MNGCDSSEVKSTYVWQLLLFSEIIKLQFALEVFMVRFEKFFVLEL